MLLCNSFPARFSPLRRPSLAIRLDCYAGIRIRHLTTPPYRHRTVIPSPGSTDPLSRQHRSVEQAERLSAADFRALYQRLRRQADWGPADRRGALNFITPGPARPSTPSPTFAPPTPASRAPP